MLFNEKFIESFSDNPIKNTIDACEMALEAIDLNDNRKWDDHDYEVLTEAYAFLVEVIDAKLIKISVIAPTINGGGIIRECQEILSFIKDVKNKSTAEYSKNNIKNLRDRFKFSIGNSFSYEFSQGDVDRIQEILNQLRSLIEKSDKFEQNHQQRLLRRLERLQSEMHKKVSDLDRFWGLIGDAGVAIGKFGEDAKPIVDRVKEITQIIWKTQARAEELPSGAGFPQLGSEASLEKEGQAED